MYLRENFTTEAHVYKDELLSCDDRFGPAAVGRQQITRLVIDH